MVRAGSPEHVAELVGGAQAQATGVIARGAGRSYGDAAQLAGGTVIDITALDRILAVDHERGEVRVQAGVSYAQLLDRLLAEELLIAVVPGTRHVTIGGAIASDVHGKNHPADGSLGAHVRSIQLATPTGGLREVTPRSDPRLFAATLGGMGLLGIVTEATLRVEPLRRPRWLLDTDRTDSLEQTLRLMSSGEGHRYCVAWLDLLARGARLGRAVVSRSREAPAGGGPAGDDPLVRKPRLVVPRGFPGVILQPPLIEAFNALRWRAFPRRERGRAIAAGKHFFPLDGLGNWNRLYGSHGLLQYQFAVGEESEGILVDAVERLAARRIPVYLAVLKRLGQATSSPLSFPIAGWTLALDMPAGAAGLRGALGELDEMVALAGGRVYLTKDMRLDRDLVATMYPRLPAFIEQRASADPAGVMRSDLGERLGLCGAPT